MGLINRKQREKAKASRKERTKSILEAASSLFLAQPYAEVDLDALARKAGAPVGTPELYFGGKEGLFLQLLERESNRWLDALSERLAAVSEDCSPGDLSRAIADDLGERELLMRLLSIQNNLLEFNADVEPAAEFFSLLQARLLRAGERLELCLPTLAPGAGTLFLRRLWILAGGIHHFSNGSSVFWGAVRLRKLSVFEVDLREELRVLAASLIVAGQ